MSFHTLVGLPLGLILRSKIALPEDMCILNVVKYCQVTSHRDLPSLHYQQ